VALPRSPYLALCWLALAYLGLGAIYNLAVFAAWKPLVYDAKVWLYLTVPYLFLVVAGDRVRALFTARRVFTYGLIAAAIDFAVVTALNTSGEMPITGVPALPLFIPPIVPLAGMLYATRRRDRTLFLLLLFLTLANLVNRLELIAVMNFGVAWAFALTFKHTRRATLAARSLVVIAYVVGANAIAVIAVVYNPIDAMLGGFKSGGMLVRETQYQNAVLGLEHNLSVVTGKGLGTTWFEYIPVPDPAGYSIGTSLGNSLDDTRDAPVKYIFNWTAPVLFYRWGLIGTLALCALLARLYQRGARRTRQVGDRQHDRYSLALFTIAFVLAMENFTFFGALSASVITSIVAFAAEHSARRLTGTFVPPSIAMPSRAGLANRTALGGRHA
jgi:hypothetical protein